MDDGNILISDGYNVCMRKSRHDSDSSMSSQRLEEILSALMKPPKDIKQNFDMDISSLLQEYMTEADQIFQENIQPNLNFSEAALLLQQSANIYGKKVDYLWLQVLDILNSFGTGIKERDGNDKNEEERPEKQRPRTRKKPETQLTDFLPIELEEATNISLKKNVELKPLATLPKNFIQFEPRVISDNDVHIEDYCGQLIGVTSDFRVNWNTDENGMLVDDLDLCADTQPVPARPTDTNADHSMQTTLIDNTLDDPTEDFNNESLAFPAEDTTLLNATTADTTVTEDTILSIPNTPNISITESIVEISNQNKRKITDGSTPVRRKSSKYDLSVPLTTPTAKLKSIDCYFTQPSWVEKLVERRRSKLKKLKRRLEDVDIGKRELDTEYLLDAFVSDLQCVSGMAWHREKLLRGIKILGTPWQQDFTGFDAEEPSFAVQDPNGFVGFKTAAFDSLEEFNSLSVLYRSLIGDETCNKGKTTLLPSACSDDDDNNHADDGLEDSCHIVDQNASKLIETQGETPEAENNPASCLTQHNDVTKRVEAWHTSIQEKLVRAEQRQNFDIWTYSSRVLNTFQKSGNSVVSFRDVITKKPQDEVARYLLATLMLANSSNVELNKVNTGGCGNFQMRLLSMERRQVEEELP